jgi:hypothetical protein
MVMASAAMALVGRKLFARQHDHSGSERTGHCDHAMRQQNLM